MNDWLDERLRADADRSVGSVKLKDPRQPQPDSSTMGDGVDGNATVVAMQERRRPAPLLAVAAGLVAMMVIGAWILVREGGQTVEGNGPASQDVTGPDVPNPDPTDTSVSDVAPSKVVADALAATLDTSWVATVTDTRDPDRVWLTVTYDPADSDHDYAGISIQAAGEAPDMVALHDDPRVLTECAANSGSPCRDGAWLDTSASSMADRAMSAEELRPRNEASMTMLGAVDPADATATDTPGTYEVQLSGDTPSCDMVKCSARVEIADGLVVSMRVQAGPEDRTWRYGSFGEPVIINQPVESDIVDQP